MTVLNSIKALSPMITLLTETTRKQRILFLGWKST